jgi:hypothetical protein
VLTLKLTFVNVEVKASQIFENVNTESVYAGVVSLRVIWLVFFLANLNVLELWGDDIGNA